MKRSLRLLCTLFLAGFLLNASSEEALQDPDKESVTISFVGDCSIGDSIQYRLAASSYHNTIAQKGYAWPFSLVSQYLKSDDLTVANLEGVFTLRGQHKSKRYNLVADPGHVQVLLAGGIDMVNTANNHSMDFYEAGYRDSLATLEEAGVAHFGSLSLKENSSFDIQAVKEVKGIRIGFIGYSYPQPADAANLAARIDELRDALDCHLVVVSLHWGRETFMTPDVWQTRLAKNLIDAGADVIYGHHPHVVQPIQFYQGKPIFYSTGNFTFGTMSHVDPSSGIFQLRYGLQGGEPALEELRVVPCQTQRSPDFRPFQLMDALQRRGVFAKLMMKTAQEGFENLPASFLLTGKVRIENTIIVP